MNTRIIGIIIAFSGLIALLAVIYFIFFSKPKIQEEVLSEISTSSEDVVINQPKAENNLIPEEIVIPPANKIPEKKINQTEANLKNLAQNFAERFGSFSNQSNFSNLRELRLFMTPNMQSWADDYKNSIISQADFSIYYGVSTKAVSSEIKELDEESGQASIMVGTVRSESIGSSANSSSKNQNIEIKLIKEKNTWKVDGAYWQ